MDNLQNNLMDDLLNNVMDNLLNNKIDKFIKDEFILSSKWMNSLIKKICVNDKSK